MEDILSNVLVFIPIAIFVALRMASAKKKKVAAEERGKFAQTMKGYAESPMRPVVLEADDEFDAHALVPDEDEEPVLVGKELVESLYGITHKPGSWPILT